MPLKKLILLGVLNTVLFTLAKVLNLPIWLVISVELLGFVVWIMVKTWFDPAQQLAVQGAHMGWVAKGTLRDENGWRDTLLSRGDVVVRISYKDKALYVLEPDLGGPYRDFVEVERMLTYLEDIKI